MTDPHLPVERGLRATVRMAAGINTGDRDDDDDLQARARRWVSARAARLDVAGWMDPAMLGRLLRHGALGGAVGAAIVALGFTGLAARAALTVPPAPEPELVLHVAEAAAKVDRLAFGVKLAALGVPSGMIATGTGDITLTDHGGEAMTSVALPSLAYAPGDLRAGAGAAIDRLVDTPAVAALPSATAPGGEEEDDEAVEPVVLPMPRARPLAEPSVLPMPKPRPRQLAALAPAETPDTGDLPPGVAPSSKRPVEPESRPSSNVLGFFSSPAEPVRPPSKSVETPFGVPYVLQTGSVETACLKPELVDILRRIEANYRQKVIITSGFRDRGRQGSLHRQCAAADIEVPGVSSSALAAFARTIPGIGGVGTYCHQQMIHVDIGTPRDWKYGCGSYFAMRGAPGKWGKVPSTMAKAQGTGGPTTVASDANEDD